MNYDGIVHYFSTSKSSRFTNSTVPANLWGREYDDSVGPNRVEPASPSAIKFANIVIIISAKKYNELNQSFKLGQTVR